MENHHFQWLYPYIVSCPYYIHMYFPMIFPVISMTYRIGKMTAPRGFEGDQGTYEMMIQRPIHLFF